MRALSAADLLKVWERGTSSRPIEQALAILSVTFPQVPYDELAKLDVVQRDLCLLELHTQTFGPRITGLAACPACRQRLEFDFDTHDLPISKSALPDPETIKPSDPETLFLMDKYEVTYRLPNSIDLATVSKMIEPASRRQGLLEACIISVQQDGKVLNLSDLPGEVSDALMESMSKENPTANLTLRVTCPDCGTVSEVLFDIVSYFWAEINAWSIRLMREVNLLAMTYGWREADILGMSAWRRQQYLKLVGA